MKRKCCPICGNAVGKRIEVPNWAFQNKTGLKESYIYVRCDDCGCLYREDMDIDYSLVYDSEYGSSGGKKQPGNLRQRATQYIYIYIRHIKNSQALLGRHALLGGLLNRVHPTYYTEISKYYRDYWQSGASFLDMGCRDGAMVNELKTNGVDAYGADPYIEAEIHYTNGLVIWKKSLQEIDRKFDVIFYNNVFEHLDNPLGDLKTVYQKLDEGGICGLSFPACGEMLNEYQENAFTIQAPQHSILHTVKSVELLADRAGFVIERFDRKPDEIWYLKSELLKNMIFFHEGGRIKEQIEHLPQASRKAVKEKIERDIRNNAGDSYHVILRKKSSKI